MTMIDDVIRKAGKESAAQRSIAKEVDALLEDMKGIKGDVYGLAGKDLVAGLLSSDNFIPFVQESLDVVGEPIGVCLAMMQLGYMLGQGKGKELSSQKKGASA